MNIIQDFVPAGRGNRPGRVNPMKYITIHNTGNTSAGATAKSHASYIKSDLAVQKKVSWHYTVDDKVIYQHIPDSEDAFHAEDGAGPGNRQSIGIEICMNSDGDLLKATNNAAELTAKLCREHNIPIGNVKQHNNWSGKNCPQLIRAEKPYGWAEFIGRVEKILNGGEDEMPEYLIRKYQYCDDNIPLGAKDDLQEAIKLGIVSYGENGFDPMLSEDNIRNLVWDVRAAKLK